MNLVIQTVLGLKVYQFFPWSFYAGELIVGPTRALFMDEISNGLDSSTTFQIVSFLKHLVHITDATALISLLQPAPETFDLFDDVILMAEGKIVYHGPLSYSCKFFEGCGFRCPDRKGVADFLQEVGLNISYLSHLYNSMNENCFANLVTAGYISKRSSTILALPRPSLQLRFC